MEVSLHPELQAFVDQQVIAGNYQNPSEMINAGLLLLRDHEEMMPADPAELAELRRQIAIGIDQANRGDFVDNLSREELAELRRKFQEGVDPLDRGESSEWDAEEIKAEGRRLLVEKRKAAP